MNPSVSNQLNIHWHPAAMMASSILPGEKEGAVSQNHGKLYRRSKSCLTLSTNLSVIVLTVKYNNNDHLSKRFDKWVCLFPAIPEEWRNHHNIIRFSDPVRKELFSDLRLSSLFNGIIVYAGDQRKVQTPSLWILVFTFFMNRSFPTLQPFLSVQKFLPPSKTLLLV